MKNIIIDPIERRLEYTLDEEDRRIICHNGECFPDKSAIRQLLIDVIENFNKANPKFKIWVKQSNYK